MQNKNNLTLYYKTPTPKKVRAKLNHLSPHVYRSLYLLKLNPIHRVTEKKIFSRGSTMPKAYVNLEVDIHKGNKFIVKRLSRWSIGFKFGEFTWNKKIAMFKAKQKKKKKIRFEHILQIYWTKGLFFGGKLFYDNKNFYDMFIITEGLGLTFKGLVLSRLELLNSVRVSTTEVALFSSHFNRELAGFLNRFYSQVSSVNSFPRSLIRLNVIRLYLIKSYKGKCHALGKPVHGQRTWSNAWTSYKLNKILRQFISGTKSKLRETKVNEKINYKVTKKKYALKKKNQVLKDKKIVSTWL